MDVIRVDGNAIIHYSADERACLVKAYGILGPLRASLKDADEMLLPVHEVCDGIEELLHIEPPDDQITPTEF